VGGRRQIRPADIQSAKLRLHLPPHSAEAGRDLDRAEIRLLRENISHRKAVTLDELLSTMTGLQSPGSHRCHGCTLSHLIRLFDCQRTRPGQASRQPSTPVLSLGKGRSASLNSGRGHGRGHLAAVNDDALFFCPSSQIASK